MWLLGTSMWQEGIWLPWKDRKNWWRTSVPILAVYAERLPNTSEMSGIRCRRPPKQALVLPGELCLAVITDIEGDPTGTDPANQKSPACLLKSDG